jgi:hypothetical protein
MFERAGHRRIARVLEALDATTLEASHCWFGGGTAIALSHGEYRESVDIDFLVSDLAGFRELRQRCTSRQGIRAVLRDGAAIETVGEVRADQYGLRTWLAVDDEEIKLEIVHEARISLDAPVETDRICGVATLTKLDLAASKVLANSDRWADDAVHNRDLIDLAMMRLDRKLLRAAIEKARAAYGASVDRDLAKAVDALRRREGRLDECMRALRMLDVPAGITPVAPAVLWKQIRRLAPPR